MYNYMEKVTEIAEALGWSLSIDDDSADFQYYTNYGQDCHMNITLTEDYDLFLRRIYEQYDTYDVSEEASLWIDSTGHGKNGAPNDLEDILNDMKEFKAAMLELWENLKGKAVRNELYIGNAHIYFKAMSDSAEDVYNLLQAICFENGIELCFDGEAILRDSDGNDIDSYAD